MESVDTGIVAVQAADPVLYATVLSVNADRAALGLTPLPLTEIDQALTEFGRISEGWDRFKNWVKGQINNPEFEKKINRVQGGRFGRKARGDLDLETVEPDGDRSPRVDLDTIDAIDVNPGGQKNPVGPVKPSRPKSSPTVKVTRLDVAGSRQELRNAGFTDKQINRWEGRGVLFRADTGKDIPPIYSFVASPKAVIEAGNLEQRRTYDSRVAALQKIQQKIKREGWTNANRADYEMISEMAKAAAMELELRTRKLERAFKMKRDDNNVGEWEKDVASEMAALLAKNIRENYPKHLKDPRNRGFMIEFDETQLINEVLKGKQSASQGNPFEKTKAVFIEGLNKGNTDIGNIIGVDRYVARAPVTQGGYNKHVAPSGAETIGQEAMLHEPGHGADMRESPWSSREKIFDKFIEQTRALFPEGGYMEFSAREWFAEMYKVMASGAGNSQQQLAARAFRNMFILNPNITRPRTPPANWIAMNQKWLEQALAAQAAGRPIPRMPNPNFRQAFNANIPKLPGR